MSDPGDTAPASVWNDSVRSLEFNLVGGFPPPSPPGSQCEYGNAHYRLTVATHTLDASRCDVNARPYQLVERAVVLGDDQLQQLEPVLAKLTPVEPVLCPLDADGLTLTVAAPAGVTTYSYCGDHPHLLDGDAMFRSLHALDNLAGF